MRILKEQTGAFVLVGFTVYPHFVFTAPVRGLTLFGFCTACKLNDKVQCESQKEKVLLFEKETLIIFLSREHSRGFTSEVLRSSAG